MARQFRRTKTPIKRWQGNNIVTRLKQLLPSALLIGALLSGISLPAYSEVQRYSVNMQNVEIADMAESMGRIQGIAYQVDPRARGTATIRSKIKLTAEEIEQVFLSQLRANALTVVPINENTAKIVPDSAARHEGLPIGSGRPEPEDRIVTQVLPLESLDGGEIIAILNPMMDRRSALAAHHKASNVLVITDWASNIDRYMTLIDKISSLASKGLSSITLQHTSVENALKVIQALINDDPGLASTSIIGDERLNILVMSGSPRAKKTIGRIVEAIDKPAALTGSTQVIFLRHSDASSMQGALSNVKFGGGTTGDMITITEHPDTNAIILSGDADKIDEARALIDVLDIRRAQVHVEAIIVEISDGTAKDLGLQWLMMGDSGKSLPLASGNLPSGNSGLSDVAGGVASGEQGNILSALGNLAGFTAGVGRFRSDGNSFGVLLNALEAQTDLNILSTPSLLTLDNTEASILVGQEVPFITGSASSENFENPFQTIERREVGIRLQIRPQINDGNSVRLDILQEVSSIEDAVRASDIITNKREVSTTVMADHEDIIVLGGLITDEEREIQRKVPLLGDIPLLGHLFRSTSISREKRNLMIFMQPRIIYDRNEAVALSSEKYQLIRAKHAAASNGDAVRPYESGVIKEQSLDGIAPQGKVINLEF